MKNLLFATATMCMTCTAFADSPSSLAGKRIVANYTQASFRVQEGDGNWSPWIPYSRARNNSAIDCVFGCPEYVPKATRNLLPLTRPGQGGKYTYRKTGKNTGEVSVTYRSAEGHVLDCGRTYSITFTSPTSGYATEEIGEGDRTGYVRNIIITVAPQ